MGISSVTTPPQYPEDYARGYMRYGVLLRPAAIPLLDEAGAPLLDESTVGSVLLDEASSA